MSSLAALAASSSHMLALVPPWYLRQVPSNNHTRDFTSKAHHRLRRPGALPSFQLLGSFSVAKLRSSSTLAMASSRGVRGAYNSSEVVVSSFSTQGTSPYFDTLSA